MSKKLIILDRDGVINYDSVHYIKSPEEWMPIPGSIAAIARLSTAGYLVAIATNQAGIGRGYYDDPTLQRIHDKMRKAVQAEGGEIHAIFYCPHHPDDGCECRKPKPGLFLKIADHFQIELTGVPAIGDSLRDIHAAKTVGCSPILVQTGNGLETLQQTNELAGVKIAADLATAVEELLGSSSFSAVLS